MIEFRYKAEIGRKGEEVLRPVADIFLRSQKGQWIELHPYIDSGADVTLIPLSFGSLLGLDALKGTSERIGGISGSIPVVYLQNKLRIGPYELTARIGWALVEKVPPLLGRADVFDVFDVLFRQKEGKIQFTHR